MSSFDRPRKGDSGRSPRRLSNSSESSPVELVSRDQPEAVKAALDALTRLLDGRGCPARIVEPKTATGRPFVHATSPVSSDLSENVTCSPDVSGKLWFRYSWGDPIAPAGHVESAAERVIHILSSQGA